MFSICCVLIKKQLIYWRFGQGSPDMPLTVLCGVVAGAAAAVAKTYLSAEQRNNSSDNRLSGAGDSAWFWLEHFSFCCSRAHR